MPNRGEWEILELGHNPWAAGPDTDSEKGAPADKLGKTLSEEHLTALRSALRTAESVMRSHRKVVDGVITEVSYAEDARHRPPLQTNDGRPGERSP
jgi:hypothetical protein